MAAKKYIVELQNYSGPLDVLLQLIQRQKLDICDIHLATVTNDYLQFIRDNDLDQNSANWFLDIAVKLILYKSKVLLPSEEVQQNQDDIDELTEQLKLLSKYQFAAKFLANQQLSPLYARPKLRPTINTRNTIDINTHNFKLLYADLLTRRPEQPKQVFQLKRQSNKLLKTQLLHKLRGIKNLKLSQIDKIGDTNKEIVMVFIMILELINSNQANISTNNNEHLIQIRA